MTTATIAHVYQPRGAAIAAIEARDPEVLVCGPAGTGKSRAILEKVLVLCLMHPGARVLFVRKTAKSMTSSALVTWREHVAKELLVSGDIWFYGGSAEEPAQYRFTNGSRIMLGGLDQPTRVLSTEYDLIYVQEAIEVNEGDWETLNSRLRNGVVPFQQLIGDTNPDSETHWLLARCRRGDTHMIESHHVDNPRLFDDDGNRTEYGDDYLARLERLTGVRRARLLDGEWVSSQGVIYEDWDRQVHCVDARPIPPDWTRYWVIDFGFTNPFVCQWWAVDPDGRLIMYREIYMTKRLVQDHARAMLAEVASEWWCDECEASYPSKVRGKGRDGADILVPAERCPTCRSTDINARDWDEPMPTTIITDHDAEDRATLHTHLGRITTPARKFVLEGIQAVQDRLRPRQDGLPGLFIMHDALVEVDHDLIEAGKPTCTMQEFPGYVWDPGAALKGKEQPLKVDDHGVDCARYMVAHLDRGGTGRVRVLP